MGIKRYAVPLILMMLSILSSQALALHKNKVHWHGFLTQGYFKTTDNNFFGDSEKGSFDFTELGLSGSYLATENLLLAGQVLSRNAGDMYDAEPSVDFLLADYMLYSSASGKSGVRIGRIKNSLGLYNDTRDVAFTRPGILVPEVIYFDKVRNLVLSADGIIFYHDLFTDQGNFSFSAGGGKTRVDENVEVAYLFEDRAGTLEADGFTGLFSGFYSTLDEQFKLGLSGAASSMKYSPGSGDMLQDGSVEFEFWIASFQYNQEKWSVSAEYMQEPIRWKELGPFLPDNDATAEAYYLQTAFHIKPELELMLRFERGFSDKDDRSGEQASALSGGFLPASSFYSKVKTIGIRWDVSPLIMLRAELQFHEGTFILSGKENDFQNGLVKDWSLFSVLASYRF